MINSELIKKSIQNDKGFTRIYRKKIDILQNDFNDVMIHFGTKIMKERGQETDVFVIDNYNRHVIEYFWRWISANEFPGNKMRGIAILGGYGTGKTLISLAFARAYYHLTNLQGQSQKISCFRAREVHKYYLQLGLDYFRVRPILIDELAKETELINNFGTKSMPMAEILHVRDESGAITFATANYSQKDLIDIYKSVIGDRLNVMFNFVELTGKSWRKI